MDNDHFVKKKSNSAIENLFQSEKVNPILFAGILLFTFAYMLFLNMNTPLIADDYVYTFIFGTSTPVMGFSDIITSQTTYYMTWGGRVIAESLTQVFMFLGKDVFNVANSFCYTIFILAVYFNAVGRKIRPEMLLAVTIMVWFFMPMFGQTVMWLTGSCNYLWCGTLILLAILPFRLYEEKQTKNLSSLWFAFVMMPLFFLSGMTNENTAGGMILMMIFFCWLYKKRKISIPAFAYSGLFFSISGFLCMLLAPGNGMRATNEIAVAEVAVMVGSNPLVTRFAYFAYNLYALMPLLIIVGIAGVLLFKEKETAIRAIFWIFILSAGAAMLVMLVPPKFPPRAMFGLASFLIIALIYVLDRRALSQEKIKSCILIPAGLMILYYIMSLGYVGIDAITVNKQYIARIEMIEENKNEAFIQVPAIVPLSSQNGMYGLKDVQMDPNHWVNRALADYYGVSNIILKP